MPWLGAGHSDELPVHRASLRLGENVERSDVSLSFYDIKFYPYTEPGVDPVFACVGADTVWVCRPKNNSKKSVEILRVFKEENITAVCRLHLAKGTELLTSTQENLENREHQLNSVCWSKDAQTGDPLIVVANEIQKINVLNVKTGKLMRTLIGHGSSINDLVTCPTDPNIIASCSKDYTIRIWNLSAEFESHPCVATCTGEGHRDSVLGISWHRSGKFLLSGGLDTVVCLWAIPDLPAEPTDHIVKVFYPHFCSNEVHWNFVDCVQWYGDMVLSRGVTENTIILWQIDGFKADKYERYDDLPPAPGPLIYKPSSTRNAFGPGFTRLLTFEVKFCSLQYMRFSLYHAAGKRPILCAGNERSKVHWWDMQQLEEGPPDPAQSQRWAGHSKKSVGSASVNGDPSEYGDASTPSAIADDEDGDGGGFRKPRAPNLTAARLSLHRDESATGDRTGSHVTEASHSIVPLELLPRRGGRKPKAKDSKAQYGIDDPFRELEPHKFSVVPKVGFCIRQVAWSVGGEWCVVCGDNGMIALFSRWIKDQA